MNLLAISGSLRKESYNTALLRAFMKRTPNDLAITLADISGIPLYNQDDEATNFPEEATKLKAVIRAADGIIIATPEYNRSIPGVLKNVIDWTSRPYGDSAWKEKPVYVIGASGGAIGSALAQYAVKQSLLYLDSRIMGQPEFYGSFITKKLDDAGNLIDEETGKHIDSALAAFAAFIGK